MVRFLPGDDSDFYDLMELCDLNPEVCKETEDILFETFDTPDYAYTTGQFVMLFQKVVDNEVWEGQPIKCKTLKRLEKFQEDAQDALYYIAGNAKRKIKGSRTKTNLKALGAALQDVADLLSTLGSSTAHVPVPKSNLRGSPYKPPKAGKKEHLARKVEQYDGINGFDISWNANKVFWTIK